MKKSNEKVLVFFDKNKAFDLDRNVEAVQQGANDLIMIFESFQNYRKIQFYDDFITLVKDPLSMFDEVLQVNVDLKESGGKKGNPAIIGQLFDIDRDNFINIVKGQTIIEGSCKPCSKLKVKQGKGVINYSSYHQYQEYLFFDAGRFEINENAVSEKKESFNFYAKTRQQIECYNFWINATETLNELSKRGYLGDLDTIAKHFKDRLTFSYQSNKLSIDEFSLLNEIQHIKN